MSVTVAKQHLSLISPAPSICPDLPTIGGTMESLAFSKQKSDPFCEAKLSMSRVARIFLWQIRIPLMSSKFSVPFLAVLQSSGHGQLCRKGSRGLLDRFLKLGPTCSGSWGVTSVLSYQSAVTKSCGCTEGYVTEAPMRSGGKDAQCWNSTGPTRGHIRLGRQTTK